MIHPLVLLSVLVLAFGSGFFFGRLQLILSVRRSILTDPGKAIREIRDFTHYFGDLS